MGTMRDAIRDATLGEAEICEQFKLREATKDSDAVVIEIRPPDWQRRAAMLRASRITIGIGAAQTVETDSAKYAALVVVDSCYEPGTQTKVFGPEDVDTIIKRQAGSTLDRLQQRIFALMNGEATDPKK